MLEISNLRSKDIMFMIMMLPTTMALGMMTGYRMDKYYRDKNGKMVFVKLSPALRKWFCFYEFYGDYSYRRLREAIICEVFTYIIFAIELLLLFVTFFSNEWNVLIHRLFYMIFTSHFFGIGFGIDGLTYSRYTRNLRLAYDTDIIMEWFAPAVLNLKRKCKVVKILDSNTCEIQLNITRKIVRARMSFELNVGEIRYAEHDPTQGAPYWYVRKHW